MPIRPEKRMEFEKLKYQISGTESEEDVASLYLFIEDAIHDMDERHMLYDENVLTMLDDTFRQIDEALASKVEKQCDFTSDFRTLLDVYLYEETALDTKRRVRELLENYWDQGDESCVRRFLGEKTAADMKRHTQNAARALTIMQSRTQLRNTVLASMSRNSM